MAKIPVLKLMSGVAFGQIIALLAYPFLTRIYVPEDLGVLGVYTSSLGILSVIASLRYDQAIPLPKKESDAVSLLWLSLSIALVFSVVTALVLITFPAIAASLVGPKAAGLVTVLLPIGVLLVAGYQSLSMFSLRLGQYARIGLSRAAQALVAAGVQIAGGFLGYGAGALLIGHAFGQSGGSTGLAVGALPHLRRNGPKAVRMREVTSRYRRFASIGVPSALLNNAALLLPTILVASAYGIRAAGFYGLAIMVLSAPVQLVGRSNAQVFFAEASNLRHDDLGGVQRMLARTSMRLTALCIVPAIALMIGGPWTFSLIFGSTWSTAGQIAAILTIPYVAALVTAPASQVFLIMERQELSLLLNLLKFGVALAAFALAPTLGADLTESVLAFGVGMTVYYVAVLLYAFGLVRQRPRRS